MASTITVNNLIDFARAHTKLHPLLGLGGVSNSPALTFANKTKQRIISNRFNWDWNRKQEAAFLTVNGTADYTVAASDVGWLERGIAELNSSVNTPKVPRYSLYVKRNMRTPDFKGVPQFVSFENVNGTFKWRLDPMPDTNVYNVVLEYQIKPALMTSTTDTFTPIPDEMLDVMSQFFIAFAYRLVDKETYLQELVEAERLLKEYRTFAANEQTESNFIPDMTGNLIQVQY